MSKRTADVDAGQTFWQHNADLISINLSNEIPIPLPTPVEVISPENKNHPVSPNFHEAGDINSFAVVEECLGSYGLMNPRAYHLFGRRTSNAWGHWQHE